MAKKKATKKKATKKSTKKATAKKSGSSAKVTAASKPRTKSEVFGVIADNAELTRKQVAQVFDVAAEIMAKDLSKRGPGVVNLAGLMKVTVQRKPATRARKGINPFTGEPTTFKAKPARNVIKVRPLKALKDLV